MICLRSPIFYYKFNDTEFLKSAIFAPLKYLKSAKPDIWRYNDPQFGAYSSEKLLSYSDKILGRDRTAFAFCSLMM